NIGNVIQAGGKNVVDGGNNAGWNFTNPAVGNLGTEKLVNDSWIKNTKPELSFTLTDPDGGQQVKYQIQVSKNESFTDLVIDYTSEYQAQGNKKYTVGQVAGGGTYAVGSAGMSLAQGRYWWRVKAMDSLEGE